MRYYKSVNNGFVEWLENELQQRRMTRADLAKEAKISQSSLSLIYSNRRGIGNEICDAIAKALRLPPETVYRAAGLLPPKSERDELIEEILHAMEDLDDDERRGLLAYIEMRRKLTGGGTNLTKLQGE